MEISHKHSQLWDMYVYAWHQSNLATSLLFNECGHEQDSITVELIKRAFKYPSRYDRFVIYSAIEHLSAEAKCQFFDELFALVLQGETKRTYNAAEQILLELPPEWLREKVREKVDKIVQSDTEQLTVELIGFVVQVDKSLARNLCELSLSLPDEYHQEIGQFYLDKLNKQ
jgi:hypothetical protein